MGRQAYVTRVALVSHGDLQMQNLASSAKQVLVVNQEFLFSIDLFEFIVTS